MNTAAPLAPMPGTNELTAAHAKLSEAATALETALTALEGTGARTIALANAFNDARRARDRVALAAERAHRSTEPLAIDGDVLASTVGGGLRRYVLTAATPTHVVLARVADPGDEHLASRATGDIADGAIRIVPADRHRIRRDFPAI